MTSAVLPSSEQKPLTSTRASRAFSRLARSLTEIALTLLSIRLTRPESTFPGPTSTNVVTPPWTSSRAACVNLTGAVSWSTRSEREAGGGLDARGHGRHERRDRVVEPDRLDRRLEPVGRPRDERAVERPRDLQLDRSSSAEVLGLGAQLLDCVVLAGDHDLARAVVVRGPDADDLAAQVLDRLVLEPEDRRHRARVAAGRLGHREPALAHEADRLAGARCADRRERGELADRVADDDVGLEPLGPDRRQDGEARRDERRLLHLGLDELLERRVEAELLEIEPRCLAADPVDLHRGRHRLGELAAHAGLERTLARETESDLAHSVLLRLSRVEVSRASSRRRPAPPHSINAEPQVRPAPIPVINTSAPSVSRPSARASASASGIEPDDVFPNRSTFTTVRSGGMPSLPTA